MGPTEGDLLVIGWGGTYGSITAAVQRAQRKGSSVPQRPPALSQPHAAEHRARC